jgi:hypothetical protein
MLSHHSSDYSSHFAWQHTEDIVLIVLISIKNKLKSWGMGFETGIIATKLLKKSSD